MSSCPNYLSACLKALETEESRQWWSTLKEVGQSTVLTEGFSNLRGTSDAWNSLKVLASSWGFRAEGLGTLLVTRAFQNWLVVVGACIGWNILRTFLVSGSKGVDRMLRSPLRFFIGGSNGHFKR